MARSVTNEARREQIVRAAIDTIAELGYAQASFARITERAGLSSPRMISYHFAGKDDLIRQIVHDVFQAGARVIHERTERESTAAGRLRAYLEANLRFLRDHPRDLLALTEIGPHLRTESGERYTATGAQELSVRGLEAVLAAGIRSGEFREFEPRAMAVLIRSAVDAAAQRLRDEPEFDFDGYTREVVTAFDRATRRE
ncbi:TetR/AcrR family transcriptional regulator [Saccharopolyspora sp. NFXS83]|uniref:TetR/AcrR family transcriptional regulator n=1 Tax=Saccharopolyspora sp. NFXS83 TaxID=2993560 RepID=UPI00224BA01F|nr:TetR/AcrR family transcriptional regulator [Saccharopolyspora sp. NFXS83]MCX2731175.1 TetR/AcrR family transcriptional regulator [Saccharopolyspora sp. NFXS83]